VKLALKNSLQNPV